MGRLYYDRKDHHDMASKMAIHFQEHLRVRYKLLVPATDDDFAKAAHAKTGYDLRELERIAGFIRYLGQHREITEEELGRFYRQIESFYQNN